MSKRGEIETNTKIKDVGSNCSDLKRNKRSEHRAREQCERDKIQFNRDIHCIHHGRSARGESCVAGVAEGYRLSTTLFAAKQSGYAANVFPPDDLTGFRALFFLAAVSAPRIPRAP